MRIVVLDGFTLNPGDLSWEAVERLGQVEVYDRTRPEQVMERLAGAEIALTNKVVLDANLLENLSPTLRYVGVLATGYNGSRKTIGHLCDEHSGIQYGLCGANGFRPSAEPYQPCGALYAKGQGGREVGNLAGFLLLRPSLDGTGEQNDGGGWTGPHWHGCSADCHILWYECGGLYQ